MTGAGHTAIPGWPGYYITTDGDVYSGQNWRGDGLRKLTPDPNFKGYPSVRLSSGGKRTRLAVHWLVAKAFLPPRPSPKHEIRHLDGDKQNAKASNLAWGTAAENAADRERHGRTSRGPKHAEAIRRGLWRSPHPCHAKNRAEYEAILSQAQAREVRSS